MTDPQPAGLSAGNVPIPDEPEPIEELPGDDPADDGDEE